MELTLRGFRHKVNKARANNMTVRYIGGPLPQDWFSRACKLPAKGANMAVALWYRHGMEGSPVKVTTRLREEYGMSRKSARRALDLMEKAGLVKVERRNGCAPLVTLLEIDHGCTS